MALATFLEGHAKVERVRYPGLPSHPAPRGRGARVALAGPAACWRSRSPAGSTAVSGSATRWSSHGSRPASAGRTRWSGHAASTTHRQMDPSARRAAGIADGLVRMSVGHRGCGRHRRRHRPGPGEGVSRRRRVVVLFGGRSRRARDQLHLGALGDRRARPRALRRRAGRHHDARGAGTCCRGRRRCPRRPAACREVTDGAGVARRARPARAAPRELVAADGSRAPIDVVLPVLHGPMGEDGAVQGLLELAGVPYVGAGVLGSAVGMDKAVQKVLFAAAGLPVVPCEVVREPEWREDAEGVAARVAALGYPVFVKPADPRLVGRASRRCTSRRARGRRWRRRSATRARPWSSAGSRACARSSARCSATTTRSPRSCGEIVPTGHEFYDYASKYLDERRRPAADPRRPRRPTVLARIQRMAVDGVPGDRVLRAWRGSTSSCGATEAVRQRDQHDPRLHGDLDVPEAVGGERAGLRRAGGAADRAGDRTPRAERAKGTTAHRSWRPEPTRLETGRRARGARPGR